jgi:hypothetical protein
MAGMYANLADPETRFLWEDSLDREIRARDPLLDDESGLAGEGSDSLLQFKTDLTAEAGAFIRSKMIYQLSGRGRAGSTEQLKGHEEGYKQASFNTYIETIRHAFNVTSPIVQQFVREDVLDEGRNFLADWAATRLSFASHAHAAGIGLITDDAYRLHNTINAINATYIIRPNNKAAGALTNGDVFDVNLMGEVAQFVKTVRPKIRPAMTPWGPRYCVFLHPDQVKDLRDSNSTWYSQMLAAMKGGRIDDNPIFTTALGEDNGFIFFESDFVPPGLNSGETAFKANTRRAWVGGAQALVMAFGRGYGAPGFTAKRWQWISETEDYGHQRAIATNAICGVARPRYTKPGEASARELGVVVVETYADHGQLTAAEAFVDWTDAVGPTATIEA